jgi:hypothetical protein
VTTRVGSDTLAWLLSPEAVRTQSETLWAHGVQDELNHWRVNPDKLSKARDRVVGEIRSNYPDLAVPLHSRWRHFEFSGEDLSAPTFDSHSNVHERTRAKFDLAIVSVLLDAGAGPHWVYEDAKTGIHAARSEGLALASLRAFERGGFGLGNDGNAYVDAHALMQITPSQLREDMCSTESNPLLGVDARCGLLQSLGAALVAEPTVFERGGSSRPGHLYDHLVDLSEDGRLPAREILISVLLFFGRIWPGACQIEGQWIGDIATHPLINAGENNNGGWVPFHKLSQWLSYSLIEPLREAGIKVVDPNALTGLAEYRNGGLLMDTGAVTLRDPQQLNRVHSPRSELIVEWRALTVAALDVIADEVRNHLNVDASQLPLGAVLQGGTWNAGRAIARELREDGGPPLTIDTDGTLF